ncbi:hypothetical protein GW916_03460 [bacterium]|nr:hypothetical protein [bacterium]
MSMLARYKKNSASMMELVKLIEESAEPKRSNLLNMVLKEDPEFGAKIQARLFDYTKLKALDESLIAEIVSAGTPKILALSLHSETDENFKKLVEKCLGGRFSSYREEKEALADAPPNEGQIQSAQRKLVSEARKLESEGAIKLMDYDKIDAEAAGGAGGSGLGQQMGDGNDSTSAGAATEASGAPSIETFGMEVPPAGLLGERLEAYVKKTLGL